MDPGIKHRRGDSKKNINITKKTSLRIAVKTQVERIRNGNETRVERE
jgi:hypothetical protein